MTFDQAVVWLDARGGRWEVRASRTSCAVEVNVGLRHTRSEASALRPDEVCAALVQAVRQMRDVPQIRLGNCGQLPGGTVKQALP